MSFKQDAYIIGDTAFAEVNIDNTKCDKDVKYVKFKLKRLIHAIAKDKRKFKSQETILKKVFLGPKSEDQGS